jgi:hypothetical protein
MPKLTFIINYTPYLVFPVIDFKNGYDSFPNNRLFYKNERIFNFIFLLFSSPYYS